MDAEIKVFSAEAPELSKVRSFNPRERQRRSEKVREGQRRSEYISASRGSDIIYICVLLIWHYLLTLTSHLQTETMLLASGSWEARFCFLSADSKLTTSQSAGRRGFWRRQKQTEGTEQPELVLRGIPVEQRQLLFSSLPISTLPIHSSAFFSKISPDFFPALAVANTGSCVGP